MAWYDDINYDDLATLFGKTAASRGQGRYLEAGAQNNQDRIGLDAAKLNLQAPGMRAGAAVQGDILSGLQPATLSGPVTHTGGKVPTISGGISPSLLSDNTRALGKSMNRGALLSQMSGPAFTPTPLPKSNGLDTALQAGAMGTGILGALGKGGGSGGGGNLGNLIGDIKGLFGKGGGSYDPWSDASNYDENGQFIGQGAWDDNGQYVGNGDDPYAAGNSGDPNYDAFNQWLEQNGFGGAGGGAPGGDDGVYF